MSNSLDSDQARHFVGPELGPNCLQRLSADDKSGHWLGKSKMKLRYVVSSCQLWINHGIKENPVHSDILSSISLAHFSRRSIIKAVHPVWWLKGARQNTIE